MKNKYQAFYYGLLILLFPIMGCTDASIYTTPDTVPHLKKNVVLLVAKPTSLSAINSKLINHITKKVEAHLQEFPSFSQFIPISQSQQFFQRNPQLHAETNQYVATFALTGVSDKDVSSRLGNALNAEQIFILQLDKYPCSECDSGRAYLLKFYLLDAQTGALLWRGRINENLDEEDIEEAAFANLVDEAVDTILEEFIRRFTIRWHRLRYENLKKNSNSSQEIVSINSQTVPHNLQ